jgi:hypothetical protein
LRSNTLTLSGRVPVPDTQLFADRPKVMLQKTLPSTMKKYATEFYASLKIHSRSETTARAWNAI